MSSETQDLIQEPARSSLRVSIKYGELQAEFSGNPESVLLSINSFLAKQVPTLSLAKNLMLNFDSSELVEKFQDYVKITPEGSTVMARGFELSDKEIVTLQLIAQKIAYSTGHAESESMELGDLQDKTALNAKSLSSRLSELAKSGSVTREARNGMTGFRITTRGIIAVIESLDKKKKSRRPS